MTDELTEQLLKVPLAKNKNMIEALTADCSNPALRDGVHSIPESLLYRLWNRRFPEGCYAACLVLSSPSISTGDRRLQSEKMSK